MSNNSYVNIRLKRETAKMLKEIGKKSETYDDVIRRLINKLEYDPESKLIVSTSPKEKESAGPLGKYRLDPRFEHEQISSFEAKRDKEDEKESESFTRADGLFIVNHPDKPCKIMRERLHLKNNMCGDLPAGTPEGKCYFDHSRDCNAWCPYWEGIKSER